jgi:hypothetical protein
MQIVSQSATFSHSPLPAVLMLPAPPQYKLLPAPRIAGLLPAPTTPQIEVIIDKPLTFEDIMREIAQFRSLEDMNAEIAGLAAEAISSLHQIRARREKRS